MQKKYLGTVGMVLTSAMVFGAAQPPKAMDSVDDAYAPRQHGPMRGHHFRDDGPSTSNNWSGYAVTGSSFTQAKASWIVPAVNCLMSANPSFSVFWVGIDGWSSPTVEQAGTDSECWLGSPRYVAWYEFYPIPSIGIPSVPVSPGDRMSAEISYANSRFTVTITDETTGKSYSKTKAVASAERSSAEWIAEAPTGLKGVVSLSDFGTVDFGPDYTSVGATNFATDSSTSGAINAFGSNVDQINMVSSGGTIEATTSSLSTDGTSFTVNWDSQ